MRSAGAAICLLLACAVSAQTPAIRLLRPAGVAYDSAGDLFVADSGRNQVIEITVGGTITAVAGNGIQGFAGDGAPASGAELNAPQAVAVGSDGTLYIADTANERIRVVRDGLIATFAGTGARGFGGDCGPALAAVFDQPVAIALDSSGAVLIVDRANQRVRRVSSGVIATVAGDGVQGFAGDGSVATSAELNDPTGLAAGGDGRIFIADTGNARIRVIGVDGKIATFAGSGAAGFSGDGGPATAAALSFPRGLAMDSTGALLIADANNHRLRRVAADGTIQTIAGSGVQGTASDGSSALGLALNEPAAAAVSGFGWPVVADVASRGLNVVLDDGKLYAPAGLSARSTQVTASTPNAVYGTAQASVVVAGGPGTPRGIAQVLDGGVPVGQAALANGAATLMLPRLSAGSHTLTVQYNGDGVHPSTVASSQITIAPAPVTASALSASVSYGAALPVLTGSLAGVLPQDAGSISAVYTVNTPALPGIGSYPISATLTGPASSNYVLALGSGSGSLTVVPAGTVAGLSPPVAAYAGLPLQLTARVVSTTAGVPTGSVQFLDGSTVIATGPLVNGSARGIYLAPPAGQHAFSVAYSGDGNYLPSTSVVANAAVTAMPDFGVSVSGSSQQTVLAGSAASYTLNVTSQGGPFTGAVILSASGLPAGASASFSPTAVVPGTSSAPVTMTISTAAQTAKVRRAGVLGLVLAAGLLLPFFRRRRLLGQVVVAIAAIGCICAVSGCGARTVTAGNLPVQSYTVTVKATSTNLAGTVVIHSVELTLGVQ